MFLSRTYWLKAALNYINLLIIHILDTLWSKNMLINSYHYAVLVAILQWSVSDLPEKQAFFPRQDNVALQKCTHCHTDLSTQKAINYSEWWRHTLARWASTSLFLFKQTLPPPIAFYSVNLCLNEEKWGRGKWWINDQSNVRRSGVSIITVVCYPQ